MYYVATNRRTVSGTYDCTYRRRYTHVAVHYFNIIYSWPLRVHLHVHVTWELFNTRKLSVSVSCSPNYTPSLKKMASQHGIKSACRTALKFRGT